MRRTPSFVDTSDEIVFRGTSLSRPDDVVGDFLENRRVLRALHEKLRFPELEDIIDDDDALDAFYAFDGTRFIKDKVMNLFDDSEYSFRSMLVFLVDKVFGGLYIGANEVRSDYGPRLYSFLCNTHIDLKYAVELCKYIKRWGADSSNVTLSEYSSDFYCVDSWWVKHFSYLMNKAFDNSNILRSHSNLRFASHRMRWRILMDWRFASKVRAFERALSNLTGDFIVNYFRILSAYMNLPDDKYAESNESELVDKWLEFFDSFYPQYEKLKAWCIQERIKTNGVEVIL